MTDGFFSLNNPNFLGIMLRFVINLIFLFILIRVLYFRYTKKEKFLFTFFLMGIMVFFICSMLGAVQLDISFAFGLFAIFAILRFRTRMVSIKDMAYIFATIGISMMNSLKVFHFPMLGIIIFNIIILLTIFIMEEYLIRNNCESYTIIYQNLDLLTGDKKQKLLKDLSITSGKDVLRYKILRVNYRRKTARVEIFYKDKQE